MLITPLRMGGASAPSLHQVFAPIGGLRGFYFSGVLLTSSAVFAAVIERCVRACARRIRVVPGPSCFSGRSFGLLAGKLDLFKLFWGILTVSGMFFRPSQSFSMSCACLHVSDVSV